MSDTTTNAPLGFGAPGLYTYHHVEGEASISQKDLNIENASFNGLISYVKNRKADILEEGAPSPECRRPHFTVARDSGIIKFVMFELGGEKVTGGEYQPNTTITASAKSTKDHTQVMQWMNRDNWGAQELGQVLKRNLHLFASETQYKEVVKALTTMRVQIDTVVEDVKKDEGEKKQLLEQRLHGQPDIKFSFKYAMFVGQPEVTVDINVLYDIDGSDVKIALFSATLEKQRRDTQKTLLEATIKALKEELGDNAVAFIELNS